MKEILSNILNEAKGKTYINSISLNEFSDTQEIEEFVKRAKRHGLCVVLHNETSNFHCGVLAQVFDKETCTVMDYLYT